MQMKGRLVIFDLDGTLALNEHRQYFVERPAGEKNWDAFFDACDKDVLNWPVAITLHTMHAAGLDVRIWSGRVDRVRDKTERWLSENGLGHIPLKMRPHGDHQPDTTLKSKWLEEASQKPMMVFDDRDSVVAMWRENDIVCAQVAPGNF